MKKTVSILLVLLMLVGLVVPAGASGAEALLIGAGLEEVVNEIEAFSSDGRNRVGVRRGNCPRSRAHYNRRTAVYGIVQSAEGFLAQEFVLEGEVHHIPVGSLEIDVRNGAEVAAALQMQSFSESTRELIAESQRMWQGGEMENPVITVFCSSLLPFTPFTTTQTVLNGWTMRNVQVAQNGIRRQARVGGTQSAVAAAVNEFVLLGIGAVSTPVGIIIGSASIIQDFRTAQSGNPIITSTQGSEVISIVRYDRIVQVTERLHDREWVAGLRSARVAVRYTWAESYLFNQSLGRNVQRNSQVRSHGINGIIRTTQNFNSPWQRAFNNAANNHLENQTISKNIFGITVRLCN